MPRIFLLLCLLFALPGCGGGCSSDFEEISADGKAMIPVDPPEFDAVNDWPWWRGPTRDGKAGGDHSYPTEWSETKNVVWKVDVPGRGLGSPVVVGNRVFLATADESKQVQSVLCYDRSTGDRLWRYDAHHGKLGKAGHADNTFASSTVACDGKRVFAVFRNDGQIVITALDLQGERIWQKPIGRHTSAFGFGTSPVIYKELVIVAADSSTSGFIAALNRKTGKIWWKKRRPAYDSYSSPVIANVAGKDQLLISGGKQVISYDPMTGNQNWAVDACAETTCGTIVWDGDMVFASGGYSKKETVGITVSANSAEVTWRNRIKAYVASMLVVEGSLYTYNNGTPFHCLDTATGKQHWGARLPAGCYGSPIFAGGHIYVPTRGGKVVVLKPGTTRMNTVAVNSLGDAMDTTPTAAGGRLFLRVSRGSGSNRRETLYCIGNK